MPKAKKIAQSVTFPLSEFTREALGPIEQAITTAVKPVVAQMGLTLEPGTVRWDAAEVKLTLVLKVADAERLIYNAGLPYYNQTRTYVVPPEQPGPELTEADYNRQVRCGGDPTVYRLVGFKPGAIRDIVLRRDDGVILNGTSQALKLL